MQLNQSPRSWSLLKWWRYRLTWTFSKALPNLLLKTLVQRMGRINRYAAQQQPAQVRIFKKQLSSYNTVYSDELRDNSLAVLSSLPVPLSEEDLSNAADLIYGSGYKGDDKKDYKDGLNYKPLKCWKKYLVAGTDREDWIREIIDEKDGSTELLPEALVGEYRTLKEQGLTIQANDLLVPIGDWRLPYLFNKNRIDKTQDPWVLTGCRYTKVIGLVV